MRTILLASALVLMAGPVLAAGHSASSSGGNHSSGGAKNRYQASWSLVVPDDSTTGETVVVFEDRQRDGSGASAADHGGGHGEEAEETETHGGEGADSGAGRMVDIPTLVAPIVVDGELVNYAFVGVQLHVADGHNLDDVANDTAYLRDAMIRSAHRTPLNLPDHPGDIDRQTAVRVWTAAAAQVLGEGVVDSVRIVSSDVRYPELAGGR